MLQFELSMISAKTSIDDAIAETIESGKSGLLVQSEDQSLGLVHFDRLIEGHEAGLELVEQLELEPVARVERGMAIDTDRRIRSVGAVFGFLGRRGSLAMVYSTSEQFGGPYASPSSGGRCKRAGKPANMLPRNWFHYYPPTSRDPIQPDICRFDGTAIS